MDTALQFVANPSRCGYLPDQCWQLEYEIVRALSPDEYMERLLTGWRRFGCTLFRPRCPTCSACRSLRVVADRFCPDRSMRRVRKANMHTVHLEIGAPEVTRAKLRLYDRYHNHQTEAKGWPVHDPRDALAYIHSFIDNPIPTEEWCYYLDNRLIGVGYVDVLSAGLSAIYFFYDPDERQRSLGTWNILNLLEESAARSVPHLYLGYYVAGCPSMQYKARFSPNQILDAGGRWEDFLT